MSIFLRSYSIQNIVKTLVICISEQSPLIHISKIVIKVIFYYFLWAKFSIVSSFGSKFTWCILRRGNTNQIWLLWLIKEISTFILNKYYVDSKAPIYCLTSFRSFSICIVVQSCFMNILVNIFYNTNRSTKLQYEYGSYIFC